MPAFDVCGLGCCAWDILALTDHYPGPDEKSPLSAVVQMGGGLAGTAMSAAAALGARAAIFGCVGDDDLGPRIIAGFIAEGVAVHGLQTIPGHTSHFAFCVAQPGAAQRAIFYKHGSYPRLAPADLDLDALTDCRALLVDHHHLDAAIAAAHYARRRGLPVVGDIERLDPRAADFLRAVDYPVIPERFALEFSGQADAAVGARRILDLGAAAVVVTQGSRGCTAYTTGALHHQPAFPITPLVDTTGAGDVLHGAFALGLALGYDLSRNLAFSAAAAALSCRALGGRGSLAAMPEVQALLAAT